MVLSGFPSDSSSFATAASLFPDTLFFLLPFILKELAQMPPLFSVTLALFLWSQGRIIPPSLCFLLVLVSLGKCPWYNRVGLCTMTYLSLNRLAILSIWRICEQLKYDISKGSTSNSWCPLINALSMDYFISLCSSVSYFVVSYFHLPSYTSI